MDLMFPLSTSISQNSPTKLNQREVMFSVYTPECILFNPGLHTLWWSYRISMKLELSYPLMNAQLKRQEKGKLQDKKKVAGNAQ